MNMRPIWISKAWLLVVCGVLSSALPQAQAAQPTNAASRLDESAFKLVTDRNIFNSRRSARYVPSTQTSTRRSVRSESFALVGTMSYGKGPLAVFDGSRSDYKKVLKHDDAIAGFKIAAIDPTFVKLATGTNEIVLPVNMQLRREDEGEWHMSARPETSEPSSSRSYSRATYQATHPAPEPATQEGDFPGAPPGMVLMLNPENGTPVIPGVTGEAPSQQAQTNVIVVPGAPSSGNASDILEILRRRREQENN